MASNSPALDTRSPSASTLATWLRGNAREWVPFAVLVLLVLAVGLAEPSFLRPRSLGTVVKVAAPLIILAIGQMFPILTGGIDLTQAVLASLGTVLLALFLPHLGIIGVIAMLILITAAGALSGTVAVVAQIPTFIVTLGGMTVWAAVSMVASGSTTIPIGDGHQFLAWMNIPVVGVITVASVLAISIAFFAAYLIRTMTRGRAFHLLGLGEGAARLAGVRTARVRIAAFAISGFTAGLAAMMLSAAQHSGSPTLANELLLPVIASVVLGGTAITGGVGGPVRALVGALTIAVLRVGLGIAGVNPAFEQIIYGAAIVVAVIFTLDRARLKIVK